GGDVHSRIKTECHLGTREIVVNGFWNADDRNPAFGQLMRNGHRTITADGDQSVELLRMEIANDRLRPIDDLNGAIRALDRAFKGAPFVGRSQDGSAERRDAADAVARQGHQLTRVDQPFVAAANPNDFPTAA